MVGCNSPPVPVVVMDGLVLSLYNHIVPKMKVLRIHDYCSELIQNPDGIV